MLHKNEATTIAINELSRDITKLNEKAKKTPSSVLSKPVSPQEKSKLVNDPAYLRDPMVQQLLSLKKQLQQLYIQRQKEDNPTSIDCVRLAAGTVSQATVDGTTDPIEALEESRIRLAILKIESNSTSDKDPNPFEITFDIRHPTSDAEIVERAAEIYQEMITTVQEWNKHSSQMLINQSNSIYTLEELITKACKDRQMPEKLEFMSKPTNGLRAKFLGEVVLQKPTEQVQGKEDEEPASTVPKTHEYVRAHPEDLEKIASLDKRQTVESIVLWEGNGERQKRIDGVFRVTEKPNGEKGERLPKLPDKLIAECILQLDNSHTPTIRDAKNYGRYLFSYAHPRSGKDTCQELVRFFKSSSYLNNNALLIDFEMDGVDYTMVLWVEANRRLVGDLYEPLNLGQPIDLKNVHGCWVSS